MDKTSRRALALFPLSLLLAGAALADGSKPEKITPPAGDAPPPYLSALPPEMREELPPNMLTGAEVPSYFVVAAFLRRAQLMLERKPEDRPDFFAAYGCAAGDPRFEACAKLLKQGADIYARPTRMEDPDHNQQDLDSKAKETAKVYADLLKLVAKQPEQAGAFHRKVEEVRLAVGLSISDEPGQDLLRAARLFDHELKKAYGQAAALPGYVSAPPAAPAPKKE